MAGWGGGKVRVLRDSGSVTVLRDSNSVTAWLADAVEEEDMTSLQDMRASRHPSLGCSTLEYKEFINCTDYLLVKELQ